MSAGKTKSVYLKLKKEVKTGSIKVIVKDDSGNKLKYAKIYLDGKYKGKTNSSGEYTIKDVSEGSHTVKATKSGYEDDSENVYVSAGKTKSVYLTLDKGDKELPTVEILSPKDGQTVSGKVTIKIHASDNVGVKKLNLSISDSGHEVIVDKKKYHETYWEYTWDTSSLEEGKYTILVTAEDEEGNADSVKIEVTVGEGGDNDVEGFSWYERSYIGDRGYVYTFGVTRKDISSAGILLYEREEDKWNHVLTLRIDLYPSDKEIHVVIRQFLPKGEKKLIVDTKIDREKIKDITDLWDDCDKMAKIIDHEIKFETLLTHDEVADAILKSVKEPFLNLSKLISPEAISVAQSVISAAQTGVSTSAQIQLTNFVNIATIEQQTMLMYTVVSMTVIIVGTAACLGAL